MTTTEDRDGQKGVQQVIASIIESLCTSKVQVDFESMKEGKAIMCTIDADREDIPQIIGSKGDMINSIRRIARAISRKRGFDVSVRVVEK